MTFLYEVFSVVLLFAPAAAGADHAFEFDAHLIAASGEPREWPRPLLYMAPIVKAGDYIVRLLAPLECSRLRLDSGARAVTWTFSRAGEAGPNRIPPPVANVLRLVTSHIGAGARGHNQTPETIMIIGIRG